MRKRPTCLDLFCGAGGMSLGFEEAGFDIVAGVELDPMHANVHAFNFPNCVMYRKDISEVSGNEIVKKHGDIDVVIGGPPCQGFSLMGKRNVRDARNHLVMEYMRVVSEINPKYFVMENVSGMTIGYGKEYLHQAISYIEEKGYHVVTPYKVLNAADYGVPQNRKRLFLLGYRMDQKSLIYPISTTMRVTVDDAIGDLPDIDQYEELLRSDTLAFRVSPKSEYAKNLHDPFSDSTNYGIRRAWDETKITGSLRTQHTDLSKKRFHDTKWGETEKISKFRKLDPNGQCNTLRAGTDKSRGAHTSPRPIHPYFDRCISVREAQRLHSFPDWFRMHTTKWHGFREVGNAVPPLLAKAVAAEVMAALGVVPQKSDTILSLGKTDLLSISITEAIIGEKPA